MADGDSSSSVAIVAIVILVLAVGAFFFVNYGGKVVGGGTKTVNVDLNVPKPAPPAPQG